METYTPTTIKQWAESDRPREKLMKLGRHNLSESELIAILIRTGTHDQTAVDVAKNILAKFNNDLSELSRVTVKDLSAIHGMGSVKAITVIAALELGRRRREAEGMKKPVIQSSKDAADILQPHLADLSHEEFVILLLNRNNAVVDKFNVSSGGVAGTVVDPKIIFKRAMDYSASGLILSHNHPSGNLKPSPEDIKLTKKLFDAGKFLEVSVLDHIIIAGNEYYSFADEGIMPVGG